MDKEPDDSFLDNIAEYLRVQELNSLRLNIFNDLALDADMRATYFGMARNALSTIVGNELAMQRRLNLSIQLPKDDSSLLPVHADVWSGDSPFETVMWTPLVDCFNTKSMFMLPLDKSIGIQKNMGKDSVTAVQKTYLKPLKRMPFG